MANTFSSATTTLIYICEFGGSFFTPLGPWPAEDRKIIAGYEGVHKVGKNVAGYPSKQMPLWHHLCATMESFHYLLI